MLVYFDNAATSWPKPPQVLKAMQNCLIEMGANPGRATHEMASKANEMVNKTRLALANLLGVKNPERIIFTLNATDALNMALKGLLFSKDHVITSSMEHNSVSRPLYYLSQNGVKVTKLPCNQKGGLDISDLEKYCLPNTKALVITHASNVTGTMMPLANFGEFAFKKGLYLVVDAAQTAGLVDINVEDMNISLLAFPGHKGLMGPPGTGGLYVREGVNLKPFRHGGTGSISETPTQPSVLPERYEAGTLNTVGIAGLNAGIDYINLRGMKNIHNYEMNLTAHFLKGVARIKSIKVYGILDIKGRLPVVSFAFLNKNAGEIGKILDKRYQIACRAGLHCAPDAHFTLGTFEKKLVRFSFSCFNTIEEIDYALECLREIEKSY